MSERDQGSAPATAEGAWRPVAPGIWLLTAEPDAVNIGLIAGRDGAVLVDTGSAPEQGARIAARISEVTDRPLTGAIITHADRDHWFGLAGLSGIPAWGHETLAERIDDPETLAEAAALGLDAGSLRIPDHLFSLAASIDLGGVQVELLQLGPGHTEGDVLVNIPRTADGGPGVLFTGDLVEQPHPWFGPHSSPRGWPELLNQVLGMVRPEVLVVPGHGSVVDLDFVIRQLAALASIPPEAERLVRAGVRLADAEVEGDWPLPWPHLAEGVRRAYAELEADGVRTRLPLAGGH